MLDFELKAVYNDLSKKDLIIEINDLSIKINEWLNSVYKEECLKKEIKDYNDLIECRNYLYIKLA